MIDAHAALARLREGNRRFVDGGLRRDRMSSPARRRELAPGQAPFAILLGCSDSRVPPEIVFDQGLGDLFVIRVAGNVAEPSQVGSIEFAVEQFGVRLVVVLGHSDCGAIRATLATLDTSLGPAPELSPDLGAIVDRIRSALPSPPAGQNADPEAQVAAAVRANVSSVAKQLRHRSTALEAAIDNDGVLVVGAEYSLQTGVVDFFDGVPQGA